jgi:RND family efflux transporter MFP subunit
MNKRVITIIGIAILLISISIIKLKSNKEKVADKLYIHDVETPILVEVASPRQHTFDQGFHYLGTFEPMRHNTIGSDAAGKVIKIGFNEGDKLSKGSFLIKLDDELLELQLENALINLESQKNDDARNANLLKDNIITGVQYEKTKLALRAAEAQVKQMKRQLQNSSIKAPFAGVVTKKMVDVGSFIGMGTPILELTDISSLKLNISVPERDVLKFKKGQNVTVYADVYQNIPFKGKVTSISVKADASHNFKIEITTPNSSKNPLMAGMYGSVKLENSTAIEALSIPRKALIGSTKKPQVFLVKNGKAIRTNFTAGTSDAEFIEIVDGLSKNDQIIIKGQINVQNKSNVITN